ncbi:MAG: hypothetical protein FIA95_06310 [Gemmatimonadetes bacterium]|nr:hypothetical protein [Gemmatimonadota bacterium]
MALRMRHWIGLALAGCACVALRLLPPTEFRFVSPPPPQDVVYERALRANLALASARLQRVRLAERIIPATLAAEAPLAFGVPDPVDPGEAARVLAEASKEAEEARGSGAGAGAHVALGLFYIDYKEGRYPGAPTDYLSRTEYYFGERDGRPYCATVVRSAYIVRLERFTLDQWRETQSLLGLCAAVARYGLPGTAVRSWLADGGAIMASTLTPSRLVPGAFATYFGTSFKRTASLGLPSATGRNVGLRFPLALERCFAGVPEGCARGLLEPREQSRRLYSYSRQADPADLIGITPVSAVQASTSLEPADRHVLADLAEEFGEEPVRRWWTAEGQPDAAFHDAFGVEIGTWYGARVRKLVTVTEPGPGMAPIGLLGAFLILALGNLLGGLWATRRRVA